MVEILNKEDFIGMEDNYCLDLKSKIYVLHFKDKFLIVKRVGKCDYKKCKSACCKFFSMDGKTYYQGFGKENEFGSIIVKVECKNLDRCGRCPLFRTRKFPRACKQFPHPSDGVYTHISDKCSFQFEVLYQINRVGKGIRDEMIRGFQEQLK